MTDENERKCWSCGSPKMERLGDYAQCMSCGATWNYIPEIGPPVTVTGNVFDYSGEKKPSRRASHPAPGVVQRARRARAQK